MNKNLKTITFKDDDIELDINISLEERTAWLNIKQIASLFDKSRTTILEHIKKIRNNSDSKTIFGVENSDSNSSNKLKYYNLDLVLEIGNRVKSNKGILLKKFVENYISNYYIENSNDIIIYNNGNISLDVKIEPKEDTVWLSQEQIAVLFDTNKQLVSYHVSNILQDNELDVSTVKEILTVQSEGDRNITRNITNYNLDMIISIGYRINSKRAIEFRKWATRVLKEYLLRGYVINEDRTLVTNENYINLINKVDSIDNRLNKLENENRPEKEILFDDGQFYNAKKFVKDIIESAKKKVVLLDPYVDRNTLDYFTCKGNGVELYIYTTYNRLSSGDVRAFVKQYGAINFKPLKDFHDRFLIIDDNDTYILGTSLNNLGNKTTSISKIQSSKFINHLLSKL